MGEFISRGPAVLRRRFSQVAIGVVADIEMGGRSNPSHKIDASEPQATPLRIAPMLKNR